MKSRVISDLQHEGFLNFPTGIEINMHYIVQS